MPVAVGFVLLLAKNSTVDVNGRVVVVGITQFLN